MAEERAQRRLAAILAADVVGYARFTGVDEIGTLTALREIWTKRRLSRCPIERGCSSK
jgi:hypothetical protein